MIFYIQADLSDHCTVDFNVTIITKIMENLTPICQRYTDVMANKYNLQNNLFHRIYDMRVMIQLTSVITNLQAMANVLQTIQVCCYMYNLCSYV